MTTSLKLLLFAQILILTFKTKTCSEAFQKQIDDLINELKKSNSNSKRLTEHVRTLTRQVMLQQLFIEERLRSEGQSGIKQIRNGPGGTKSYHTNSHTGKRAAAIHDHSNNIRTVGMGELIAVLNGVEFRTRHNDYRLYMPSTTSTQYQLTEDIPFPDIPPEVTQKENVTEQVKEMVEWFKAWKYDNDPTRDHKKYFKPVLCYLEGAWTKSTRNLDEPFESDRHFVDATSWFDLQEKIRFTSYTGRKDNLENFAFLPTKIMEQIDNATVVLAQWNYRILCHPLKRDLPVNRLRMIDDLGARLTFHHTAQEQVKTRGARFQVNPRDSGTWKEAQSYYQLLDQLMGEIPGMDNYPANLTDYSFGQTAYSMDPKNSGQVLNSGYYHRRYKVLQKGAMGVQYRHRGFSDPNLFMAMTTQDNIAGMKLEVCEGTGTRKTCEKYEQKWSYAIPLEIIYLTPLNKWNPYNLTYKGNSSSKEGRTVTSNGRNGGLTKDKAFNGVNSKTYYITPDEFFAGSETQTDAADTTKNSVGVLDPIGKVRRVRASGTRIFLPNIPGVGILRQRYPIMPIHAEGSTTWKELEAVEDFLMQSRTHARLFREQLAKGEGGTKPPERNTDTRLETGPSSRPELLPNHVHEITLTEDEVKVLKSGKTISKVTSTTEGHQHEITVGWATKEGLFYIAYCVSSPWATDKYWRKCRDGHMPFMRVLPDQ